MAARGYPALITGFTWPIPAGAGGLPPKVSPNQHLHGLQAHALQRRVRVGRRGPSGRTVRRSSAALHCKALRSRWMALVGQRRVP